MSLKTFVSTIADIDDFTDCLLGKFLITLDIEGIDLSRIGTIELISVGIELEEGVTRTFLFDASPAMRKTELHFHQMAALKPILENADIVKIIHDCRQDSDVLYAHLGIKLSNVFDSVVWNMVIHATDIQANLNDTLTTFDCATNDERVRMKDIYKINPKFWSQRPVTPDMISYASGDVSVLFDLYRAMSARVADSPELQDKAEQMSATAVGSYRDCLFHALVSVPSAYRGKVIGSRGANIRKIEQATGCWVSNCHGPGFLVLAPSAKQLAVVKKKILNYVR